MSSLGPLILKENKAGLCAGKRARLASAQPRRGSPTHGSLVLPRHLSVTPQSSSCVIGWSERKGQEKGAAEHKDTSVTETRKAQGGPTKGVFFCFFFENMKNQDNCLLLKVRTHAPKPPGEVSTTRSEYLY